MKRLNLQVHQIAIILIKIRFSSNERRPSKRGGDMSIRKALQSLAISLCVFALQGCGALPFGRTALPQSFVDEAIQYNEMAAKVANAQMLLNILRAKDRHPRRFSAITDIANDRTVETQGGLTPVLPFGGDATSSFSLGPSVSQTLTASPNVNIKILESKEFMTGMLRALPEDQVSLFWQTGWPKDVLLYVLAREIKIPGVNDPIYNWARRNQQCTNAERDDAKSILDKYLGKPTEPHDLSSLPKIDYAQFAKRFVKDGHDISHCLFRAVVKYVDERSRQDDSAEIGSVNSECKEFARLPADTSLTPIDIAALKEAGLTPEKEEPENNPGPVTQTLHTHTSDLLLCDGLRSTPDFNGFSVELRSVDQAIYYVGELIRNTDLNSGTLVGMRRPGKSKKEDAPLFAVFQSKDTERNFAAQVVYDGQTYYAGPNPGPDKNPDRTATVLTLLDQLFQLNTSASELTGPQSVQIVN